MTKKISSCYPPSVVLEDLSFLEDVSTCSSTSTITCSVWSSISNLDRSSIRHMSSLTFSGMLDDDECYLGGGEDEDDNGGASLSSVCQSYSARNEEDARRKAKNIDKAFALSGKTTTDPLGLSERSLFQEPLSPIRRNEAPKAPARRRGLPDDGPKNNKEEQQVLLTSRPVFTKSSSCPSRVGTNTICTTTAPFLSLRGIDVKPEIPTRSSHDWNDDGSGISCGNHDRHANLNEKTPRDRRKQLMKRINHVHHMLANDHDDRCQKASDGVSLNRLHEEPPKLPRRGVFIDTPAGRHPSSVVASSSTPCHHFNSPIQNKHKAKDDLRTPSQNESPGEKASNYPSFDKTSGRIASKVPPTKPRRKKRLTKTPNNNEEVVPEPPPSLQSKVSKPERDPLQRRSRSKVPPQRFASAPAALHYNTDAEKYPIPKRIIKRNRSSEHHRRRGQVISNSSLASILESDDENLVASSSNSPRQRGRRTRPVVTPFLSRSGVPMMVKSSEMSKKEKEHDVQFPSRTPQRSSAGLKMALLRNS